MSSFDFANFRDFFAYQVKKHSMDPSGRKNLTLKDLAKRLGYNSPSLLTMISKGERLPSSALLESLFAEWKIPTKDQQKIRWMVEIERREQNGKEKHHLTEKLNQVSTAKKINLKKFEIVSDWHILVVKILVGTPGFQENPQWISQRLRRKITPRQAERALQILEEQKYICRDGESGRLKVAAELTETTHEIPSEAIRNNHRGMIQRAVDSIEEQDLKNRQLNSLALQFDRHRIAEAKERILNFIHQFNNEFSSDSANDIFQLNIQFFEHTNGGSSNDQ
jgi:uncharacterized protein (TIGR02147 family)